jgi:hypothetical protein
MQDTLSRWMVPAQNSSFQVIVAGMVSGGLLDEAFHTPTRWILDHDVLHIDFARDERLTVSQPSGIEHCPSGDLRIAHATEASFSWRPRSNPNYPEGEYLEIFTPAGHGRAVLTRVADLGLAPGPIDLDPTAVSFGGEGVPFVTLARIAGA